MGINPHALYQNLEKDLRMQIPTYDSLSSIGSCETPRQAAAFLLKESFYKKFVDQVSTKADAVALENFVASNSRCNEWSLQTVDTFDDILIGGFKRAFQEFSDDVLAQCQSFMDICEDGRFGPGASIGVSGVDFYTKSSSSPLTSTSVHLSETYDHYISKLPIWKRAESVRFASFGSASIVPGNRLSFVPKNQDTARCICIEPSLNMFYQLGFGRIIERSLKRYFGINLMNQQDKNRVLARIGSTNGDYCTIDLKNASDTISLKMLKQLCPPNFVWWLERLRSPKVELPNGKLEELHMVSSMGNGFTFPLETAIFACVVSSVYDLYNVKLQRPRGRHAGNFSVFGDDIIVKNNMFKMTCRLLNLLGFTVNEEKSFNDGWFRESCGCDYFRGHMVRGIYIKSLKTQQNRVVALNRLNRWSAYTGVYLPSVCAYLMNRTRFLPVPFYENDDAGIKVPLSYVGKNLKRDDDTQGFLYRRYRSQPKVLRIYDGEIKVPRKGKSRIYNPDGLFLALLHGSLESYTISIRMGVTRYRVDRGVTSNWTYLPADRSDAVEGWQLETAICLNLGSPRGR